MFICLSPLKDACKEKNCVKMEGELLLDAKYGDSSLITETMAAEEEKLLEQRAKANSNEPDEVPVLNDIQFTKLDELLTQTQLYTEFLLENMDDISKVGPEKSVDSMISVCLVVVSAESVVFVLCNQKGLEGDEQTTKEKKKGRGSKRKAASNYNNVFPFFLPFFILHLIFMLSPILEVFMMSFVISKYRHLCYSWLQIGEILTSFTT